MRGPALVVLLAAACLVATWSFVTSAKVIDSNPCEKVCYDEESSCVSACGTQANPVECEEQCHDQLLDCLKECR